MNALCTCSRSTEPCLACERLIEALQWDEHNLPDWDDVGDGPWQWLGGAA